MQLHWVVKRNCILQSLPKGKNDKNDDFEGWPLGEVTTMALFAASPQVPPVLGISQEWLHTPNHQQWLMVVPQRYCIWYIHPVSQSVGNAYIEGNAGNAAFQRSLLPGTGGSYP